MASPDNDNMIHRLQYGDRSVTLVGTAHVSKESARLVEEIILSEQPDAVCVELCASRYHAMLNQAAWQEMDIIKVIKEKKAFLLLSNLLLASFQKRVAQKLGVKPGQEMLSAIQAAEAVEADICLADRDIRITLSRTWRAMGLWRKIKMLFQLLLSAGSVDDISEADIEKMKQEDMLESILAEVGKAMPELRQILIDERDRYLAQKIKSAPGQRIVAVVGAGHVPGIKATWEHEQDLKELESIPPRTKSTGLLKWIVPSGILALLIYGFSHGGAQTGSQMISWWVLANGVLAGIGALVALAHPLTILSSIVAAPITSLNPMIAAGWVSGMVEAFSRRPKVLDFERLPEDILSIKGFWRNKVTRILMVVVFTNLGSSLGTMVAIPMMAKVL